MSIRAILARLAFGIALVVAVYWLETFAPPSSRTVVEVDLPEVPGRVWLVIGGYLMVAFAAAAFVTARRNDPTAPSRRPALKWFAAALAVTVVGGEATLVFAEAWAVASLAPAAILPTLLVMAYIIRRLGAAVNWRLLSVAFVAGTFLAPTVALVLTPLVMLSLLFAQGSPQATLLVAFVPLIFFLSVAVPLAEEAAKQVGVVMLRARIRSATDAFMVGAAAGAGFAIVEDLLYISVDLRPVDWPVVVATRALSHLIHPLLAGLISLQAYGAIRGQARSADRIIRTYLVAALLHGLWNLPWAIIYQIRPVWDPLGGILDREQADLSANLLLALVTALVYLPLVLAMWKALVAALEQLKVPLYASPEEERMALFEPSWRKPVARLTTFVARQARLAALIDRAADISEPAAETPATLTGAPAASTLPVEGVGFRRRFAAWLLDLSVVFVIPAGLAVYQLISSRPGIPWWLPLVMGALLAIGSAAFLIATKRTIGKAVLGLWIADERGRNVGRGRLLARELVAKPLSGAWLLFGFLWAGWDERKQGWHDLLAGTRVVGTQTATAPSISQSVDAGSGQSGPGFPT